MSVALCLDHNVSPVIARALRAMGVDCITALEDGSATLRDEPLLARTTALDRVLYTEDDDFFGITARWQRDGRNFPGVLYAKQRRLTVGQVIGQLVLIGHASDPKDWRDRLTHLPL